MALINSPQLSPMKIISVRYSLAFRELCCIKYCRFWMMMLGLFFFGFICALMTTSIFQKSFTIARREYSARVQPLEAFDAAAEEELRSGYDEPIGNIFGADDKATKEEEYTEESEKPAEVLKNSDEEKREDKQGYVVEYYTEEEIQKNGKPVDENDEDANKNVSVGQQLIKGLKDEEVKNEVEEKKAEEEKPEDEKPEENNENKIEYHTDQEKAEGEKLQDSNEKVAVGQQMMEGLNNEEPDGAAEEKKEEEPEEKKENDKEKYEYYTEEETTTVAPTTGAAATKKMRRRRPGPLLRMKERRNRPPPPGEHDASEVEENPIVANNGQDQDVVNVKVEAEQAKMQNNADKLNVAAASVAEDVQSAGLIDGKKKPKETGELDETIKPSIDEYVDEGTLKKSKGVRPIYAVQPTKTNVKEDQPTSDENVKPVDENKLQQDVGGKEETETKDNTADGAAKGNSEYYKDAPSEMRKDDVRLDYTGNQNKGKRLMVDEQADQSVDVVAEQNQGPTEVEGTAENNVKLPHKSLSPTELSSIFARKLSSRQLIALHGTIRACFDLFEKAGLTYFLQGRSLLGYYRHHGSMIPWDNRVGIALLSTDKDSINNPQSYYFEKLRNAMKIDNAFEDYGLEKAKKDKSLFFISGMSSYSGDKDVDVKWLPIVRIAIAEVKSVKTNTPIYNFMSHNPPESMAAIHILDDKRPVSYWLTDVLPLQVVRFEGGIDTFAPSNIEAVLKATFGALSICRDGATKTVVACSELAHLYSFSNMDKPTVGVIQAVNLK